MNAHVFVDESKARGLLLAAAVVPAEGLAPVCGDSSILCVCPGSGASTSRQKATRVGLTRLVDDAAKMGAQTLERDDQSEASDKMIIRSRTQVAGSSDTLRYLHKRPYEECVLAIPDAVAWSWAKGGHWRRRCRNRG